MAFGAGIAPRPAGRVEMPPDPSDLFFSEKSIRIVVQIVHPNVSLHDEFCGVLPLRRMGEPFALDIPLGDCAFDRELRRLLNAKGDRPHYSARNVQPMR